MHYTYVLDAYTIASIQNCIKYACSMDAWSASWLLDHMLALFPAGMQHIQNYRHIHTNIMKVRSSVCGTRNFWQQRATQLWSQAPPLDVCACKSLRRWCRNRCDSVKHCAKLFLLFFYFSFIFFIFFFVHKYGNVHNAEKSLFKIH